MSSNGRLSKFGTDKLPIQKTISSIDWVIFGDKEDWPNQQPQYYESLYRLSSKNNAILKQKNRYVFGQGFDIDKGVGRKLHDVNKELTLRGFLKSIDADKVVRKLICDRNLFGGFACEMIYSKDAGRVIPHYIPFKNIRVSKTEYDKEGNLIPTVYYYTSDWSKGKKAARNEDFETFQQFDWDNENPNEADRYLVYFKDDGYEDETYPLPDYLGGVPYIDADTEVGNFVYNNVKNGFTGGYFVEFYDGEPTVDQQRKMEGMFKSAFHGTDNAGKSLLNWADQAGDSTKITPLNDNGQDDRYINLNNQIREEVFTAHSTSPLVVGMSGENGFNNNSDEKRVAVETFKSDFVHSAQQPFNEFFNQILEYNEIEGFIYLEDLEPIKKELSEQAIVNIYNPKQLANIYGLPEPEDTPELTAVKELNVKFKNEIDNIIASGFESCGIEDTEFEVIDSFELCAKDSKDAQFQSIKHRLEKFATSLENSILKYLTVDPQITPKTLSTLLDKPLSEIEKTLSDMLADGLINEDNEPQEQPEDEVFTVYKYEKRSDVSGASVKETTRPFCRRLVAQSSFKSWTIQDINKMNNGMGLDVFASRGGWRTIEGTDRHVPFCRHVWKSMLVRRKPQ